jgi:Leucine-rich repeat (LRR) protein
MKKLFIILVTCYLLPVKCKAQTWVTIPDANFATYLQSIIPAAMSGNQMNTSSTLVTTTTQTISVSNKNIANLSGIQYFTSLTYLNCGDNSLTSIPTLPNSITYLNCFNNTHITSLPTLPSSLTYLDCSDNFLTSLPLLPSSLDTLNCNSNSLTGLPALPSSLIYLACSQNALASLPTLPSALTYLNCDGTSLTSLPELPNSLVTLFCEANIFCFPTFPNSITILDIIGNPYNCLPNHIAAMSAAELATPLCAAGNTHGCPVAGIQQVAGINNQVSVYPNPASTSLTLTLSQGEGIYSISMCDMLGKLVMQHTYSPPSEGLGEALDVSNISEGVYNLSVSTSEGIANKRVVIAK